MTTWPDATGWFRAGLVGLTASFAVLSVAYAGNLASFAPVPVNFDAARLAALIFFVPALGEELLFRAGLLPRKTEEKWLGAAAVSVVLFVLWHPLQVVVLGPPWSGVFLKSWFLGCVAILGAALAIQYRLTLSIWPCVITHWIVVAGWKLLFGGPF